MGVFEEWKVAIRDVPDIRHYRISGNTLNYLAISGILNPANEIRKILNVKIC